MTTRRDFILTGGAMAVAGSVPINLAAANDSTLAELQRRQVGMLEYINSLPGGIPDEEIAQYMDIVDEIEEAIISTPSNSLEDLAIKLRSYIRVRLGTNIPDGPIGQLGEDYFEAGTCRMNKDEMLLVSLARDAERLKGGQQ